MSTHITKSFCQAPCHPDDKRKEIIAQWLIDTAAITEFSPIPIALLNLILIHLMKPVASFPISAFLQVNLFISMEVFFIRMVLNDPSICSLYERKNGLNFIKINSEL